MPRAKYTAPKGFSINCFAIIKNISGVPDCCALDRVYCARGSPCNFYATPDDAVQARQRSRERLQAMGVYDGYRKLYGGV